jgi:SAM-dependent methyltransferase
MSDFEKRFQANAQQAEYWNTVAGAKWVRYDAAMDVRLRPLADELLQRASIQPGYRVLEVGCGGGSTTEQIAEVVGRGGAVLGIDISEPLLNLARARCEALSQVSFENADAQVYSFPEGGFDILVSRFGVMFFSDPVAAFANLSTALRPGGQVHFACWAPLERNPWFTIALGVAKRHLGALEPTPPRAPGPLAFGETDYVEEILSAGGFREISIDSIATKMAGPEPVEAQAELYLKLGPASRLIDAAKPGAETMNSLTADLVAELKNHQTSDGIALDATVHYVSARV